MVAMAEDGTVQSNASNKRPREEPEDLGVPGASFAEASQEAWSRAAEIFWGCHYLCPLCKELPVFPVRADDGMDYDLGALAEYCGDPANSLPSSPAQGPRVKSPATGLPMSTNYVPAEAKQAAIIHLFRKGRFEMFFYRGHRVTSKLKKYLDLRERAWSRDIDAVRELVEFFGAYNPAAGNLEDDGSCGGVDGVIMARNWWLRVGAEANDKHCMARFGTELYGWITSTEDLKPEEEAPRLQQAIASIAGSAELVDEAALTMAKMYLDGLFDEQDDGRPRLVFDTQNIALLKKGVLRKAEMWLNKALHTPDIDKTKQINDRMRELACGVLAKVRRALAMKDEGVAADKDPQRVSSVDIDTSDGGISVPSDVESELHELNFYLGYDEHKDKWQ